MLKPFLSMINLSQSILSQSEQCLIHYDCLFINLINISQHSQAIPYLITKVFVSNQFIPAIFAIITLESYDNSYTKPHKLLA